MNNKIKCLCGKEYEEKKYKKHLTKCDLFIERFKNFDCKISILLGEYLQKKENFIYVRFLLKRYLKLIDKKIKKLLEIEDINKTNERENTVQNETEKLENTPKINGITPKEDRHNINIQEKDNKIYEKPGGETYNNTPGNENYTKNNENDNKYCNNNTNNNNYNQNYNMITPNPDQYKYYNNKNSENNCNNKNNDNENNKQNNIFNFVFDFGKNYLSSFFNVNKMNEENVYSDKNY